MNIKTASSVYDELSLIGEWWLPDEPEKQCRGELTGSASEGFSLSLEGSLEDFYESESNRIILGQTREGKLITLGKCWVRAMKGRSATYLVHFVMIGGHFPTYDSWRFGGVRFGIHLLDDWHNPKCFSSLKPENDDSYTLTYRPPRRELIAETDAVAVYLDYDINPTKYTVAQTEYTLKHAARIEVLPLNEDMPLLPHDDSHDECTYSKLIHHLRGLIALATSAQVFPYDVRACPPRGAISPFSDTSRQFSIQIYWIAEIPCELPTRAPHDMVFTWEHIKSAPVRHINAWLSKTPRIGMPVWLYLDAVCHKHRYAEDPYISLVKALEGYHRYANPNESLPSEAHKRKLDKIYEAVPPESLKWLMQKLAYSHEPSLAKRLRDLFRNQKECSVWLLGAWKNVNPWIQEIKDTRNAHAHCLGEAIATAVGDPRKRHREKILMQAIMLRCLLSELEFESELAMCFMRRNREFAHFAKQHSISVDSESSDWL